VIFEIQQSSDTTYRVFDWNRPGLDGKPRDLHVRQSMASIDFADVEPSLANAPFVDAGALRRRPLVRDPLLDADAVQGRAAGVLALEGNRLRILAVTEGAIDVSAGRSTLPLEAGQFCVVPASVSDATVAFTAGCGFLDVTAGTRDT
jgi:mannose-6-phosphate isomerase